MSICDAFGSQGQDLSQQHKAETDWRCPALHVLMEIKREEPPLPPNLLHTSPPVFQLWPVSW